MNNRQLGMWLWVLILLWVLPGNALSGSMGLVGHYRFDGNGRDASGSDNPSIAHNGVRWADGKWGQAACFDGTDDYLAIPRLVQKDFTLSVWLKTRSSAPRGAQCYEGSGIVWSDVWGVGNDFILGGLGNRICMFTGNPDRTIVSRTSFNTDRWVHVSAVRKQSNGQVTLYINGSRQSRMTAGKQLLNANPNLHIGGNTLDKRFFKGCLDDLRIYDRALSKKQISRLYRGTSLSKPAPAPRPGLKKPPKQIQSSQPTPQLPSIAPKDRMKIAVMAFRTLDDTQNSSSMGDMVSEMFTTEVVNSAAFKIVEREQLKKVLQELQVGQSGIIDTSEAQEVGKMLGAHAIITGSVMKLQERLRIDARIIEVETGVIISAERRICDSTIEDISQKITDMTTGLAHKFYKHR